MSHLTMNLVALAFVVLAWVGMIQFLGWRIVIAIVVTTTAVIFLIGIWHSVRTRKEPWHG
jgi:predicted small integral membrane protein